MKIFFLPILLSAFIGVTSTSLLAMDPNQPEKPNRSKTPQQRKNYQARQPYPGEVTFPNFVGQGRETTTTIHTTEVRNFGQPPAPAQPAPAQPAQLIHAQNLLARVDLLNITSITALNLLTHIQNSNLQLKTALTAIRQTQAFAQEVVLPSITHLLNPFAPLPQDGDVAQQIAELRQQSDQIRTEIETYTSEVQAHQQEQVHNTVNNNHQASTFMNFNLEEQEQEQEQEGFMLEEEVIRDAYRFTTAQVQPTHTDPVVAAQLQAIQNMPLITPPVPQAPVPTEPNAATQNQTGTKRKRNTGGTSTNKRKNIGLEGYPGAHVLTNAEAEDFETRIRAQRAQQAANPAENVIVINDDANITIDGIEIHTDIEFTPEALAAIFNNPPKQNKGSLNFLLNSPK